MNGNDFNVLVIFYLLLTISNCIVSVEVRATTSHQNENTSSQFV